jgi:acyl-CoA thioesterase-1
MNHIISRRTLFCLLFAGVLIFAACGSPPAPETIRSTAPLPADPVDTPRVVFLGDSLSAGKGLAESDESGTLIEVVNAGVSGDTSAGGLARLDWVLGQQIDVLVVELGGNDALRGQSLDATESNLRQIVQRGLESGARVLLLGMDIPTNYGPDYGAEFSAMYARIADQEGAILVPGFVREVGSDPELMQPDGLHPTAEGHRRLAETLAPYLERLLGEISG